MLMATQSLLSNQCRITSYNVCYTKLLRLKLDSYPSKALETGIYPGMLLELSATGVAKHSTAGATDNPSVVFADKDVNDPDATVEMAYDINAGVYAFQLQPVITSYSIHYTKLYEFFPV